MSTGGDGTHKADYLTDSYQALTPETTVLFNAALAGSAL